MSEFKRTIQHFQVLPHYLITPSSWLFISCELIVVIFIILGETLLLLGFALAMLLLSVFSVVLISVLIRKIQTPCNCFGSKAQNVSPYDVGRNFVFILFTFGGWKLYATTYSNYFKMSPLELIIIGSMALVFVLIVLNAREIVQVIK